MIKDIENIIHLHTRKYERHNNKFYTRRDVLQFILNKSCIMYIE